MKPYISCRIGLTTQYHAAPLKLIFAKECSEEIGKRIMEKQMLCPRVTELTVTLIDSANEFGEISDDGLSIISN